MATLYNKSIFFMWVNEAWVRGNSIIVIPKSLTLADQAWRGGDTAGSQCPKLLAARDMQRERILYLYAMLTWWLARAHVDHMVRGNNWIITHQTLTRKYPRFKFWLRHWWIGLAANPSLKTEVEGERWAQADVETCCPIGRSCLIPARINTLPVKGTVKVRCAKRGPNFLH